MFERINTRIMPGGQLGEATLDVDAVRARPYALTVALNNYRPPSIGEKGYDVAGLVRDLTGWGDVFDVDVSGPIGVRGGTNYSGGWLVPLNRYDTQLSIRGSYADTVVTEQPLEVLDIESRIDREELRLTQPLWGSLAQQFNLGAEHRAGRRTRRSSGVSLSHFSRVRTQV